MAAIEETGRFDDILALVPVVASAEDLAELEKLAPGVRDVADIVLRQAVRRSELPWQSRVRVGGVAVGYTIRHRMFELDSQ